MAGALPRELRASYVAMRNQMGLDVPSGGVDAAPVVFDEERLTASETRLARSYGRSSPPPAASPTARWAATRCSSSTARATARCRTTPS